MAVLKAAFEISELKTVTRVDSCYEERSHWFWFSIPYRFRVSISCGTYWKERSI